MGTGDDRELPVYARVREGYRIEHRSQAGVAPDSIVGMWVAAGVLSEQQAERRVEEVCMVAVEEDGGDLAGVSTIYLQWNEQLQAELWYGRVFVAEQHRSGLLATRLMLATRIHLSDRFRSGDDVRARGLFIEVESERLKRAFPEGAWPTHFTFVGVNRRGDHCRVHWFPGARAPLPSAGEDRHASARRT